jgi:hypothetical protein
MPQANVLRVGCSLVEHWLFDSSWLIPDVSTACRPLRRGAGFRKSIGRMGWGGWSTLLGPEETDTRLFLSGVGCLQVAFELASPGWWGGFGRTGRSGLHTASVLLAPEVSGWGFGWFGGGVGWCPFVF